MWPSFGNWTNTHLLQTLKSGTKLFCSETVRDFLDMSDFLNLMDLAIQEKAPSGVFNVSTGVGNTIHDVFSVVSSYLNIEVPEVPVVPVGDDDVAEVVLDPVETEKAFNWKANVNFEETINNQLQWYDKYGLMISSAILQTQLFNLNNRKILDYVRYNYS